MKKIQKVLISFNVALALFISKSLAAVSTQATTVKTTIGDKLAGIGKVSMPVIVIGVAIFILLAKSIAKIVKTLIILGLIAVAILAYFFIYK